MPWPLCERTEAEMDLYLKALTAIMTHASPKKMGGGLL